VKIEKILWAGDDWEVVEFRDERKVARFLRDNCGRLHSGVVVGGTPPLPVFSYARAMLRIGVLGNRRRILVLGGGGFSIPTALFYFLPESVIHVVDRDKAVEGISRDYFFKPDDRRLVFTAEMVEKVPLAKNAYDLVLVDVFDSRGLACEGLFREDRVKDVSYSLVNGGGLVWNVAIGRGSKWVSALEEVVKRCKLAGLDLESYCHKDHEDLPFQNVLLTNEGRFFKNLEGWTKVGGWDECTKFNLGGSGVEGKIWPDCTEL
jgi:hypothetical protein